MERGILDTVFYHKISNAKRRVDASSMLITVIMGVTFKGDQILKKQAFKLSSYFSWQDSVVKT